MKPRDRRMQIEAVIRAAGSASVDDLAARFGVSTETIRRDLACLAGTGRVQKVHGGARSARLLSEPSMAIRTATASDEKTRMGRLLADEIEPGATIFIDTGSTTLAAAPALAAIAGLTVITNSCRLAEALAHAGSDAAVHLLGGRFRADNAQTVGPSVLGQIADYQADHCVLTVAAFAPEIGAMDACHDEAQIARAMMQAARNLIVLADSSKLDRRAAFTICPTARVGLLITDDAIPPQIRADLAARGLRVAC
ncbi:MAG: DeoR/GlpR family DNA-binding transcription regulator [Paracoccus sp. (in: a-proteobacteria)]|nr:DeoR/GlpR family DNA-binding transcription regulator [Paracoccus sp. (in: a-proteobacteria)]